MANVTRVAVLKDALCDALLALTGSGEDLEGVAISSAELATQWPNQFIEMMGEDMIEQEWGAMGRLAREEAIVLTGRVYVHMPGQTEAVIRAARSRAVAIVGVIEDLLTGTGADPTLGGVVKAARCRPAELFEAGNDSGRIAMVRFEIRTQQTRLVRA